MAKGGQSRHDVPRRIAGVEARGWHWSRPEQVPCLKRNLFHPGPSAPGARITGPWVRELRPRGPSRYERPAQPVLRWAADSRLWRGDAGWATHAQSITSARPPWKPWPASDLPAPFVAFAAAVNALPRRSAWCPAARGEAKSRRTRTRTPWPFGPRRTRATAYAVAYTSSPRLNRTGLPSGCTAPGRRRPMAIWPFLGGTPVQPASPHEAAGLSRVIVCSRGDPLPGRRSALGPALPPAHRPGDGADPGFRHASPAAPMYWLFHTPRSPRHGTFLPPVSSSIARPRIPVPSRPVGAFARPLDRENRLAQPLSISRKLSQLAWYP